MCAREVDENMGLLKKVQQSSSSVFHTCTEKQINIFLAPAFAV